MARKLLSVFDVVGKLAGDVSYVPAAEYLGANLNRLLSQYTSLSRLKTPKTFSEYQKRYKSLSPEKAAKSYIDFWTSRLANLQRKELVSYGTVRQRKGLNLLPKLSVSPLTANELFAIATASDLPAFVGDKKVVPNITKGEGAGKFETESLMIYISQILKRAETTFEKVSKYTAPGTLRTRALNKELDLIFDTLNKGSTSQFKLTQFAGGQKYGSRVILAYANIIKAWRNTVGYSDLYLLAEHKLIPTRHALILWDLGGQGNDFSYRYNNKALSEFAESDYFERYINELNSINDLSDSTVLKMYKLLTNEGRSGGVLQVIELEARQRGLI